ncbi:MAG: TrbI/VirB10 family protein [Nostocaceae cyanobacterium]|nr:TrbI/VirB10 family protein [Nostocaceae cyanobacterium]
MNEDVNGHNAGSVSQVNEHKNVNWNEASLTRLLGYDDDLYHNTQAELNDQDKVEVNENDAEVSSNNVVAIKELFDDPQEGKTKPTFATNPFAKFGTVGLLFLVVFGAGATFLNTIMFGKPKVAPKIAVKDYEKPKIEINEDVEELETGKLKAELALASQAEKIKSLETAKSHKNAVKKPKITTNKPTPNKITSREVRPKPVAYVPPPRYSRSYPTSTYRPPRVASRNQLKPVVNKVPEVVSKNKVSPPPSIKQPTDPMEEWMAINQLGSYGSVEISNNTISTQEQSKNQVVDNIFKEQAPSPITIPRATAVKTVANTIENTDYLQPLHAQEAAIINGVPIRQLKVGTTASAKLITPLIWGKNSNHNATKKSTIPTEGEKFLVQLVKPLTGNNGLVILPKSTQIIVHVQDIEKSGLVQLEATQILIDGSEYVLPPGVISIRGISGKPLMASKWGNKGGEIAARDAETFVVGSLAKVGKVLNQPKSEQYSTSSGFSGTTTFSSTKRGNPNILGAVLEGGFEPLTEQILKRNQRKLSEIKQREKVWYVRAGSDVQVFVNQSFQL